MATSLPTQYDLNLWNADLYGKPNADGEPRWRVALYHNDGGPTRARDDQLITTFPIQPPTDAYDEDHFYVEGEYLPEWLLTATLDNLNNKENA